MSKIESPHVFAAIICIAVIAMAVIFFSPANIKDIAGMALTSIGMLGMKLAEHET